MATSFRRPFNVIQRTFGVWQEGIYQPSDFGTTISVMATVQMPSAGDLEKIQATAYGNRASRYIKIYTDTRLHCVNQKIEGLRQEYPGDIFLFDDSQYLLFGESNFQMLSLSRTTQVSHWRYYACELIEGYAMENVN